MLSIHEADLVRRDGAVPGLAKLLDPEAFLAALQAFVPETKLLAAQPIYIRYKPGVNCLVAYQLETPDSLIDVYAKTHGLDAPIKIKNAALPKTAPGPLGPGRIVLDDCAIVVSFFPNDSNLKRLYRLNETEVRDHLQGKFLPGTAEKVTAKMEKLAYKPERRYVARMETNSGSKAVLKFYTQRTFLTMRVNAKAFVSNELLRIPSCLGKSNRHSVLGFEWLSGRLLLDVIVDAENAVEAVNETGAALVELHAQQAEGLVLRSREAEAAAISALADWLSFVCPALAERTQRLAQRLSEWILAQPIVQQSIHGDFYAKQVLWSKGCVRVVDLDEAAWGDPRADLCLFIAHLERDVLRGRFSTDLAPILQDALIDGYRQAGGRLLLDGIPQYIAVSLFRLLHGPFRVREPEWFEHTGMLLDRVEAILGASENGKLRIPIFDKNQNNPVDSPQGEANFLHGERSRAIHSPIKGLSGQAPGVSINDPFNVTRDLKMPFIERALNPEEAEAFLARMLLCNNHRKEDITLQKIRVVRHKPGRRCLVEYDVAVKSTNGQFKIMTLTGKARARGLDTTTYRICERLYKSGFHTESSDGISVPRPMGTVPEFQMWFQGKAPGIPATHLFAEKGGLELAERIADAIYKVHRLDISTYRQHTIADELKILHDRLALVARVNRQWSQRLERILSACDRLGTAAPTIKPTGIHRDFYPDHVLADDDRLYLLDFDLYCMGDPGLDVGNFLGHLMEQSLRTLGHPYALKKQMTVMKERFLEHASEQFRTSIKVYTTLTLVRHIYISTLFPERRPFTRSLMQLCEQRLGVEQLPSKLFVT